MGRKDVEQKVIHNEPTVVSGAGQGAVCVGGLTQSEIREGFSEAVALMRDLQEGWEGASEKGPSRKREQHKQRPCGLSELESV